MAPQLTLHTGWMFIYFNDSVHFLVTYERATDRSILEINSQVVRLNPFNLCANLGDVHKVSDSSAILPFNLPRLTNQALFYFCLIGKLVSENVDKLRKKQPTAKTDQDLWVSVSYDHMNIITSYNITKLNDCKTHR
ncbi:hypothetical protein PoB_001828300 [Plakobranchus ocellatus]|uniref:Uncharacterized protein n=1 Tax=Plakobranchus ocellatus TaxID=259542 RepID=A0AAV3ZBH5_9GAST|nr:hypothetical protein PoB_001828300 [Plakobranchus ocellatus]